MSSKKYTPQGKSAQQKKKSSASESVKKGVNNRKALFLSIVQKYDKAAQWLDLIRWGPDGHTPSYSGLIYRGNLLLDFLRENVDVKLMSEFLQAVDNYFNKRRAVTLKGHRNITESILEDHPELCLAGLPLISKTSGIPALVENRPWEKHSDFPQLCRAVNVWDFADHNADGPSSGRVGSLQEALDRCQAVADHREDPRGYMGNDDEIGFGWATQFDEVKKMHCSPSGTWAGNRLMESLGLEYPDGIMLIIYPAQHRPAYLAKPLFIEGTGDCWRSGRRGDNWGRTIDLSSYKECHREIVHCCQFFDEKLQFEFVLLKIDTCNLADRKKLLDSIVDELKAFKADNLVNGPWH